MTFIISNLIITEEGMKRGEGPEVIDNYKEKMSSWQSRAAAHMNSQWLWRHTQDLDIPNSNMEKGVGCETPLVNEELFTNVSC